MTEVAIVYYALGERDKRLIRRRCGSDQLTHDQLCYFLQADGVEPATLARGLRVFDSTFQVRARTLARTRGMLAYRARIGVGWDAPGVPTFLRVLLPLAAV